MPLGGAGYKVATALGGQGAANALVIIEGMTAAMAKFTEALSPGTMLEFNHALMDLQATIGEALEPIFTVFTGVFRDIAGTLLPSMQALRPVIDNIASIIGNLLKQQVMSVATVFELLAPVLEIVSEIFRGLSEVLLAIATVGRTVGQTLIQWVYSFVPLKEGIAEITKAFKTAVSYIYLFVGAVAKGLGFDNLLKNLIGNIAPKGGLAHAPTSSSIKGFESIAKDLATASFIAAGGTEGKKFDLGDVVKELKDIQAGGGPPWVKDIIDLLKEIKGFLANPAEAAKTGARKIGQAAGQGVVNWANNLGAALFNH